MSPQDVKCNLEQNYELHSPPQCILLLNGFPGVGKLTIAKALECKLKLSSTPYALIDNHKLIDPVMAIEPIRNAAHYVLRKLFRKTAFDLLVAVKDGQLIIFTACLAISKLETPYNDIEQLKEYVDMADQKGVPLVVVNIVCDLEVNSKRLRSIERVEMVRGKTKLVDVEILQGIRGQNTLLNQEDVSRYRDNKNVLHLELDTTDLEVNEAAQKIWELMHTGGG